MQRWFVIRNIVLLEETDGPGVLRHGIEKFEEEMSLVDATKTYGRDNVLNKLRQFLDDVERIGNIAEQNRSGAKQ